MEKSIKTPLRYPGGKSKAINQIKGLIPPHDEFREPFLGGGSVFLWDFLNSQANSFLINDVYKELYLFWSFAINKNESLILKIVDIRNKFKDGRKLFESCKENIKKADDLEKAACFFILNRITFSGTIESGGYSAQAFEKRFTESSINRLKKLRNLNSKSIKITNLDYENIIKLPGKDVFIFLDPPYYSAMKSKLYGKKGDLHSNFDYERLAETLKKCHHKWLMTIDDSEYIRKLFSFAKIREWKLQYGMTSWVGKSKIGKELFISNYLDENEITYDN